MRLIGLAVLLTLSLFLAPLAVQAQQPTHVHRIGWLAGTTPGRGQQEALLEEMRALGYVEGQHLVMEHRGAEGQYERFPALGLTMPQSILVRADEIIR